MQTGMNFEEDPVLQISAQVEEKRTKRKRDQNYQFVRLDRETQLKVFFNWLPSELHDAPEIDWVRIPPTVMGYCVRTVAESPSAAYIASAIASACEAMTAYCLLRAAGALHNLFQFLYSECCMKQIPDLRHQQLWQDFLAKTKYTEGVRKELKVYKSITEIHYPMYLQQLNEQNRLRMQPYALPPIPHAVLSKHFPHTITAIAAEQKRKAQSDILVPLYPVLRQLVRVRKQAAERMLHAIREARNQVKSSVISLPYSFQHTNTIPNVNHDARTVAEIEIQGREVTMHFILWDKRAWVLHHPDRFSHDVLGDAKAGRNAYTREQNCFFVQFVGSAPDLLWFGDIIEHRLIQSFNVKNHQEKGYQERWNLARSLGFSAGCQCSRPGLLSSSDKWFSEGAYRDGDFLFEPEALYQGILYGAALAMVALSNGSRLSELLQISWNEERRITRIETVPILREEDGCPLLDKDGKALNKQVKLYLQYLLPKGAKTEEERQLFPLSKEAMRLLGEIKQQLKEVHGEIPIVHPSRSSAKYEHLKPEQYLFQWAANTDGTQGMIVPNDVQVLLRFILHGLDLYTAQGEPIRITAHLLRHVMATHARQYRQVPPEAIAHFFLHHRLKALTGQSPSPSEITDYYSQMTEGQRFATICEDLDEQEEMDHTLMHSESSRDLAQMNEDLRIVYEQWQTLHLTAFGYCGCPGLCPRGYNRSLCIGCSYLVTDPEKIASAIAWQTSYTKQAEQLESQGNFIDARQACLKARQLDDIINVMHLQQQAEADGQYIPLFKVLPQPRREKNE
jgi:hypothetical protein